MGGHHLIGLKKFLKMFGESMGETTWFRNNVDDLSTDHPHGRDRSVHKLLQTILL